MGDYTELACLKKVLKTRCLHYFMGDQTSPMLPPVRHIGASKWCRTRTQGPNVQIDAPKLSSGALEKRMRVHPETVFFVHA
jgi:hypothetical protein